MRGSFRKKQKYLFKELIAEIKERYLQDGDASFYKDTDWCVYAKNVDDNDNDMLPEFAVQSNLEFVYRDEMPQDVIAAAVD